MPQITVILLNKCYQKLFINLIMTEQLRFTDTKYNVRISAYIDFKVHRYSFSWPDKITTVKLMPNLKKILFII